jgi:hypothetical protein
MSDSAWIRKRNAPSRPCSLITDILKRLQMNFVIGTLFQRKKELQATENTIHAHSAQFFSPPISFLKRGYILFPLDGYNYIQD